MVKRRVSLSPQSPQPPVNAPNASRKQRKHEGAEKDKPKRSSPLFGWNDIDDISEGELTERIRRMGRPRKYDSPEVMERAIDDYLRECAQRDAPLTWSGLTLALGFVDDDALNEYGQRYADFSPVVKRARRIVVNGYESDLRSKHLVGSIFALKNLAGWSDKQEIESRSLTANVDLDRLNDEQLRRVRNGENVLQVLTDGGEKMQRALPPARVDNVKASETAPNVNAAFAATIRGEESQPVKRKRGRPRKNK